MKKYLMLAGLLLVSVVRATDFSDDFNRADVALSHSGTAVGSGWKIPDKRSTWGIEGQCVTASVGDLAVLMYENAGTVSGNGNEFSVSLDVKGLQNTWSGLAFHINGENDYYCFRIKSGTVSWALLKYTGGKPSTLASGKSSAVFQMDTAYTLQVHSAIPGQFNYEIKKAANGAVLVSGVASDAATPLSGGVAGIFQSTPGPGRVLFDNFRIEGTLKASADAAVLEETSVASSGTATPDGERLYNGIVLPAVWPPQNINPKSTAPMPVPYLDHIPKVIPIDVGRQLLFDDFLIAETDLERTFHYPQKYEGNPVLKAETPLELDDTFPGACPKSGGLWWDPDEQIFKLWYEACWLGTICYATSTDGIDWNRPNLDVVPGSNQVLPPNVKPDSWTVVRDWDAKNQKEKYKIFVREGGGPKFKGALCFLSPDGIHWDLIGRTGVVGDRSTMFYNPFRKKWVYSIRSMFRGRSRHYWEEDEFGKNNKWNADDDTFISRASFKPGQPVIWAGADELDPPDEIFQKTPALYNLDAVAYESIMLGFYQIWRGPDNTDCVGFPKITELNFAYSRDGFHWDRPDRTTAIEASREAGTWDRGYVQSLGNICVLRGDKIWFYYTGYAGDERFPEPRVGMYANGAMGVAFLRRDGFASMKTGEQAGTLTTRPVSFSGKYLFVNADMSGGLLTAEILDESGTVLPPFTKENSRAFSADSTIQKMEWEGGSDLSELVGRPVQVRFYLQNGELYSFWVSRDDSGRSDGYVAGGGPGYTGATDTVGTAALDANEIWESN